MGDCQTRYRLLFESSLDGLLLADPDGAIHAANPYEVGFARARHFASCCRAPESLPSNIRTQR